MMASLFVHALVEDLLSQMTLREKVSLLAGTNMWHTVPVERLGIPSLKMTDGESSSHLGNTACWMESAILL
jgi:beta-glucosidase